MMRDDTTEYQSYRVRLYPNKEQLTLLAKTVGCCRVVYNELLAWRQRRYNEESVSVSGFDCCTQIPRMKASPRFSWLAEVSASALQQSVLDMDRAYQNYFKHGSGFPRFQRKGVKDSFRATQGMRVCDSHIKLEKIGWIRHRGLRAVFPFDVRPQNVTVRRESNGAWYASILVKQRYCVPFYEHKYPNRVCGIDLGVTQPVSVAYKDNEDRTQIKVLGLEEQANLKKKEKRRKHYQKTYARKVKGSKNQAKAKLKVGRAFWREANVRKNCVEQVSHEVCTRFPVIALEDLRVKNMTKGGKHKQGLNREILRMAPGALRLAIERKARKYRGEVLPFPAAYTSQDCNVCGHRDKDNRQTQALFKCLGCGHEDNADANAAKNIRWLGVAEMNQRTSALLR